MKANVEFSRITENKRYFTKLVVEHKVQTSLGSITDKKSYYVFLDSELKSKEVELNLAQFDIVKKEYFNSELDKDMSCNMLYPKAV